MAWARFRSLVAASLALLGSQCAPGSSVPPEDAPVLPEWPDPLQKIAAKAFSRFGVPTVLPAEVVPDQVLLIDVRTPEEVAVSRIPEARLLVSQDQRDEFLHSNPSQPVVVYCTAGWRSAEFTEELVDVGIPAVNLSGGICAWAAAERPVVDADGNPTRRIHSFNEDFADCVPENFQAVSDD